MIVIAVEIGVPLSVVAYCCNEMGGVSNSGRALWRGLIEVLDDNVRMMQAGGAAQNRSMRKYFPFLL